MDIDDTSNAEQKNENMNNNNNMSDEETMEDDTIDEIQLFEVKSKK